MLFDPTWENNSKSKISKADLISWLETKDPNEKYNYCHAQFCLTGQYLTARGRSWVFDSWPTLNREMGCDMQYVALGRAKTLQDVLPNQWTFGQALERAKDENHVWFRF